MEYYAGTVLSIADCKKTSLTARGLIGISNASTPQITVTIEDGGVFDTPVVQYSSSKTSFAFDVGAGLRYIISKCIAIDLKGDYFYTDPDFTINNSSRVNNARPRDNRLSSTADFIQCLPWNCLYIFQENKHSSKDRQKKFLTVLLCFDHDYKKTLVPDII